MVAGQPSARERYLGVEEFAYPGFLFDDRADAGRQLGSALAAADLNGSDLLVLALPRGGVPVGVEVAKALDAEIDVMLVRKLGLPGHNELAMGAVASGGICVLNEDVVGPLAVPFDVIDSVAGSERGELQRREHEFRGNRPPAELAGRRVVLVDDGLATGASMRAAIEAARKLGAREVTVAVPVAPADTCRELEGLADSIVCLESPAPFMAVGAWYEDFHQVKDEEVRTLLEVSDDPQTADRTVPNRVGH